MKKYNMQELAKKTDLSSSTIRYYDNLNLLNNVERDENNYRIFNDEHVKCLNVYKKLRDIDMSLNEIEYVHQKYSNNELNEHEINEILNNQKKRIEIEIESLKIKLAKIDKIKAQM